jgi:hypothetical protein
MDASPLEGGAVGEFGHVMAGDALYAPDPISTAGLQSAILSGIRAAAVANTVLADPDDQRLALSFYEESAMREAQKASASCAELYSQGHRRFATNFWNVRAGSVGAVAAPLLDLDESPWDIGGGSGLSILRSPEYVVERRPALEGDRIVERETLVRTQDSFCVCYIDGIHIAPLVLSQKPGEALLGSELMRRWSSDVPEPARRSRLLGKLLALRILQTPQSHA